jgi:hypothetical protein
VRSSQRAVFGRGLRDIEPAGRAQRAVGLGRGTRSIRIGLRLTLGFLRSFPLALGLFHVGRDRNEDLADVVAQSLSIHVLGRRTQGPRERLALVDDQLVVRGD